MLIPSGVLRLKPLLDDLAARVLRCKPIDSRGPNGICLVSLKLGSFPLSLDLGLDLSSVFLLRSLFSLALWHPQIPGSLSSKTQH